MKAILITCSILVAVTLSIMVVQHVTVQTSVQVSPAPVETVTPDMSAAAAPMDTNYVSQGRLLPMPGSGR